MKLAILLLLALIGLVFGFFLYRTLIRSRGFAKLIGGTIETPPETPGEVINRLDEIGYRALDHADRADVTAQEIREAVIRIRERLPRRRE